MQIRINKEYLQLVRVYGADFVELIIRLRGVDFNRLVELMAASYVPGIALDTLVEAALYGMRKAKQKI